MKPNEMREKSDIELVNMASGFEQELFTLRFRIGAGQLKQTSNVGKVRRDLARVRTIQRERAIKHA